MASDELLEELKSEASRSLEREKSKCENLAPRVVAMETELANMLNVKVEDLVSLSVFVDKFSPKEKKVDLPDIIKHWKAMNGASGDTPLVIKGCRQRAAATKVVEIYDSDDEASPGDISSGKNKRKR